MRTDPTVEFPLTSEGVYFAWKILFFTPISIGLFILGLSQAFHFASALGNGDLIEGRFAAVLAATWIAAVGFGFILSRFRRVGAGRDGLHLGSRVVPYSAIRSVTSLSLREEVLILNVDGKRYITVLPSNPEDCLRRLDLKRKGFA